MRILFLVLFLTNCGNSKIKHFKNDRLLSAVNNFSKDFDIIVTTNVVFVDKLPDESAGVCIPNENRIELSSAYQNSDYLEPLVYHQLGHCVFGLPHFNEELDIMNYPLYLIGWGENMRKSLVSKMKLRL
jgi:hypothetical protein